MTNHAKVGGILSIVSGVFGILWLLGAIFIVAVINAAPYAFQPYDETTLAFVAIFYVVIGVIGAVLGVIAIVGGVFALKKKAWGMALAGAIAGTITFFPCGIPAIIFVSMGKREFNTPKPQLTSPTV